MDPYNQRHNPSFLKPVVSSSISSNPCLPPFLPQAYLSLDGMMVLGRQRKHGANINLMRLLLLDRRLHLRGIPEGLISDVNVIIDRKRELAARKEVTDDVPPLTIRVIPIRQPLKHGLIRKQTCVEESKQLRAEFLVVHSGCGGGSDVHAVLVFGARGRGPPGGGGRGWRGREDEYLCKAMKGKRNVCVCTWLY